MNAEARVLKIAIEMWIENNMPLVQKAQVMAQKILNYGLLDSEKTMPFQIFPTEISGIDGVPICKLYVFLECPLYGFFSIELTKKKCIVSCPNTYIEDEKILSFEECHNWIDSLDKQMDPFYGASSAAEAGQTQYCQLMINQLLTDYQTKVAPLLEEIKNTIAEEPRTAIVTNNFHALVKNAKKDYDKALLAPHAWVVFKDENELPEQGENIEEYVDEEATEKLGEVIRAFFKKENYIAAEVYLLERLCLQSGLSVIGLSKSEDEWQEATMSEENGDFVLPAIDILEFKIA